MADSETGRRVWFPPLVHLNVPNVLTSLSVLVGVTGLMAAAQGQLGVALLCGAVAIPLDMADGYAARRLGQGSAFGGELDSLADIVSFGVLPALVAATVLGGAPWLGAVAALHVLAGAWRLAHFNITPQERVDGRVVYRGVPIPYMSAWILVAVGASRLVADPWASALVLLALAVSPPLMLSALPVPKGGWHYRVMYLILPAALAAWRWA